MFRFERNSIDSWICRLLVLPLHPQFGRERIESALGRIAFHFPTSFLKEQLRIVGPYRWVRNPMYTSIYIILISFFLVSANWLIGLTWLAGYTGLMISRVPKEETLMEQQFGDEYGAWAARTGRFLPRIRKE